MSFLTRFVAANLPAVGPLPPLRWWMPPPGPWALQTQKCGRPLRPLLKKKINNLVSDAKQGFLSRAEGRLERRRAFLRHCTRRYRSNMESLF